MRQAIRRTAVDKNQAEIVAALRKIGAVVFIIGQPFDLLVRFRGQWRVLEVKEVGGKLTPGQLESLQSLGGKEEQEHAVRVVKTPEAAILACHGKE